LTRDLEITGKYSNSKGKGCREERGKALRSGTSGWGKSSGPGVAKRGRQEIAVLNKKGVGCNSLGKKGKVLSQGLMWWGKKRKAVYP